MNRASIANSKRLRGFLDRRQYANVIVEQFMSIEEWDAFNKLDRAVISKMAWWFHSYVDKLLAIPKKWDHIPAQFALITIITAVEATVGSKKQGGEYGWERIYRFYEHNLSSVEKQQFIDGMEWYDQDTGSLRKIVRELVNRRNGLLHSAELPNIPSEDIIGVAAYGSDRTGRARGVIETKIKARQLRDLTKSAILNYTRTPPGKRQPTQDLRHYKHKVKT